MFGIYPQELASFLSSLVEFCNSSFSAVFNGSGSSGFGLGPCTFFLGSTPRSRSHLRSVDVWISSSLLMLTSL